jgi:pimeloyl-ACP methyl ester carboxylesterase
MHRGHPALIENRRIGLPHVLAAAAIALAAPAKLSAMRLDECRLESTIIARAASARCGWFEAAEDRSSKASRRVRIHVAVIPALRRQPLPDPIFIISGGPGQAASDFYLISAGAFEAMRRDRDLVVIDQRGTGKSQRLDCVFPDELETTRLDAEEVKGYTRECLAKLKFDPRFFSTSVAVRDLDEIRAALGYEQVNLYGISYGTRVAQHYLRRFPKRVRTIILDGVVPVDTALGPDIAPAAQAALDSIVDRCAAQAECQSIYPALKEELSQLLTRLTHNSVAIQVADPRTAVMKKIDFSYMHVATALRLLSYADDTAALLPYLIHQATHDRPELIAAQALLVAREINDQVANGMHNAVVCTEDTPYITAQALENPAIDRSYLRRYFVDTLIAMCSAWPRGVIDADLHAPLTSTVPALLLSGANDPVTPSEYGERASHAFKHGLHIVVPGHGHGQLSNACVARLMQRFVEHASTVGLDTGCVAKQAATSFLLGGTSPGP